MKIAVTVQEQGELLLGYYWQVVDDQWEPHSALMGPYQQWYDCLNAIEDYWATSRGALSRQPQGQRANVTVVAVH
jgi:hypothetical protein